jgi:hypothetical protein
VLPKKIFYSEFVSSRPKWLTVSSGTAPFEQKPTRVVYHKPRKKTHELCLPCKPRNCQMTASKHTNCTCALHSKKTTDSQNAHKLSVCCQQAHKL